jgi:hypothetical protein
MAGESPVFHLADSQLVWVFNLSRFRKKSMFELIRSDLFDLMKIKHTSPLNKARKIE